MLKSLDSARHGLSSIQDTVNNLDSDLAEKQ